MLDQIKNKTVALSKSDLKKLKGGNSEQDDSIINTDVLGG